MIGISKLYCGAVEPSDPLRYGRRSGQLPSHLLQFSIDKKPVVVWNVTRACNLKCVHCYAHATDRGVDGELKGHEALSLLKDLAAFGVPVVLFSGGEPMMRPDLLELARCAVDYGMRAVISTNGTLITKEKAREPKQWGFLMWGEPGRLEEINDRSEETRRFQQGDDWNQNCQEAGIKVGLRLTLNKMNLSEVPRIFDLLEEVDIPRVCFYHLVYAGRGSELIQQDLDHEETRKVVDLITKRTKDLHDRGKPKEVLTVDNHADGPYLYLKMVKEGNQRAAEVLQLLKMNEATAPGVGSYVS
jgi:MoaA/NifB/PqqE/SkfB family radical SAM enzyme